MFEDSLRCDHSVCRVMVSMFSYYVQGIVMLSLVLDAPRKVVRVLGRDFTT